MSPPPSAAPPQEDKNLTKTGSMSSKLGRKIAKVLQIELPPRDSNPRQIGDSYVEDDPTVGEWLLERKPTPQGAWRFFLSLFPFIHWIGKYNRVWFIGDLIAGLTVGAVVVPQGSMAPSSSLTLSKSSLRPERIAFGGDINLCVI